MKKELEVPGDEELAALEHLLADPEDGDKLQGEITEFNMPSSIIFIYSLFFFGNVPVFSL